MTPRIYQHAKVLCKSRKLPASCLPLDPRICRIVSYHTSRAVRYSYLQSNQLFVKTSSEDSVVIVGISEMTSRYFSSSIHQVTHSHAVECVVASYFHLIFLCLFRQVLDPSGALCVIQIHDLLLNQLELTLQSHQRL